MQFNTGVIHGRFQILHNDHLVYLMSGKSRCNNLVVGITNPDPSLTDHDDSDSQRSLPTENPLTYYERQLLIKTALCDCGINHDQFVIVPLPINYPALLRNYVPPEATYFLSIYDDWGRRKREILESLGLMVEVISERSLAEKGISGTDVRRRIVAGETWRELVPPSTYRLLIEWNISDRLRQLSESPQIKKSGNNIEQ